MSGQLIALEVRTRYCFPKTISDSAIVLDNMLLSQRLSRTGVDEPFAIELLDKLGIGGPSEQTSYPMSQGKARAPLRALAHRPASLIADEPTSALIITMP